MARKKKSQKCKVPSPPPIDPSEAERALELQTLEIKALQSIFDTEFTLHPSTPVYRFLFSIVVDKAFNIILDVDLGRLYPIHSLPHFTIRNVSSKKRLELENILRTFARNKLGDAMIYEMVLKMQEFLSEQSVKGSFFQEMILRNEKLQIQQCAIEKELLAQKETENALQRQQILHDIQQYRTQQNLHPPSTPTNRIPQNSTPNAVNPHPIQEHSSSSSSLNSNTNPSKSRFFHDFKELGILGRGGGGQVVKAQNRLDRQMYAIKKIKLETNDPNTKKKILREVKTISGMHHRHIVRYFQSWLECDLNPSVSSLEEMTETDDDWLGDNSSIHSFYSDRSHSTDASETLFIQMEFCKGNALSQIIDNGALHSDMDKIWTLFRQILEAVAYIHSQNVIHRDIKPANIFLDAEGVVKVGDFGLAVCLAQFELEMEKSANHSNCTFTNGVGTVFYRAPELERIGYLYDQKADIFSLGILFFEMISPPFSTFMERALALTELREKHHLLNMDSVPENVRKLILCMCESDPTLRPSAAELLKCDLIPPKMQVESLYLKEALETLVHSQSRFYGQLMDAVFAQSIQTHVDYAFDHVESFSLRFFHSQQKIRTSVRNMLERIFTLHGAIACSTPLLMPKVSSQGQFLCARLVNVNGIILSLPFDLTERLARFVARNSVLRLKCYQSERVYRRNCSGGHPKELMEADFDIVWDEKSLFPLLEVEVLQIVMQVMENMRLLARLELYYLRLNDVRIVKGLFVLGNVPKVESCRRELLKLLSNEISLHVQSGAVSKSANVVPQHRWKYLLKRMRTHGMTECQIRWMEPFFSLAEDGVASLDLLQSLFRDLYGKEMARMENDWSRGEMGEMELWSAQRELKLALKETEEGIVSLRRLLQYLETLQCMENWLCVRIDLGFLAPSERFSSGLVFQAIIFSQSQRSSHSKVKSMNAQIFAEGGRYDSLLTRFKLPAANEKSFLGAVGVRFSLDKIVSFILSNPIQFHDQKFDPPKSIKGQPLFLICSLDSAIDLIEERYQLAMTLWKEGIAADFVHPNPEELQAFCVQRQIQYQIIVQQHLLQEKNQVKLRSVGNVNEPDMVMSLPVIVDSIRDYLQEVIHNDRCITVNNRIKDGSELVLSPMIQFKLVESKKGKDRHKHHSDSQRIANRVSKWVASNFLSRKEKGVNVLSMNLPFCILRKFGSLYMEEGMNVISYGMEKYPRYRKVIQHAAEELKQLEANAPANQREMYVMLHSICDDRYDLISVRQQRS